MFSYSWGQLTLQVLQKHGGRPEISSCLNTEPAHRALIKFAIRQNKHISAEVSGVVHWKTILVPIFSTSETGRWFASDVHVWTVLSGAVWRVWGDILGILRCWKPVFPWTHTHWSNHMEKESFKEVNMEDFYKQLFQFVLVLISYGFVHHRKWSNSHAWHY